MDEKYPPAPPLGTFRLATVSDVPRIAVVATASFFYSPLFAWERRYHAQYSEDTVKDYARMFADFIRNPEAIVLVAEDTYRPDEHSKTKASITPNSGDEVHQEGETVVVGVAAWHLPPGSKRVGQFVNQDDLNHNAVFDGGLSRDKDPEHGKAIWSVVGKEESRHFSNHYVLERLAVHPAYWRRGHAKRLLRWGLELANLDRVKSGVSTEPSGDAKDLYLSLGYVKVGVVSVKDEEDPPNHVGAMFLEHDIEPL